MLLHTDLHTSIEAIFYDLDGVLINTKDWHFQALNSALAPHGQLITADEQEKHYEGLPTTEKLKLLTKHNGLKKELHNQITNHKNIELIRLFEEQSHVDITKIKLLKRLKKYGFIQILCSNTTKSTVELMIRSAELYDYFDHIITRQDIKYPKPNPEIYLCALRLAGVPADKAMIIEDSDHGVVAATLSGAHVMKVQSIREVNYKTVLKELKKIA